MRLTGRSEVWLEDVAGCMPRDSEGVYLPEVWFEQDREETTRSRPVSVHIGVKEVGVLDELAANRYRPVLDVANDLGEIAWTHGRLVRRSNRRAGFLLVVPLPCPSPKLTIDLPGSE